MVSLQHPFPAVDWAENGSFGGSQSKSAKWQIRKCGCGAVAMTDWMIYLSRYHGCEVSSPVMEAAGRDPIPAELYDRVCCGLQRKFLPMVSPFGINGLSLAAGMNAYCALHRLPCRFRWNVTKRDLFSLIQRTLERDLPVVLAIGPNLPALWQQHKLQLYRKSGDTYTAVTSVKAHYVMVTAMDENWLEISSWGRKYYIHKQEYLRYGEKYSTFLVHNILIPEPR